MLRVRSNSGRGRSRPRRKLVVVLLAVAAAFVLADLFVFATPARARWLPLLPGPALQVYRSVVPSDPAAYYVEGVRLRERGRPREARNALEHALRLRPDFVVAKAELAATLLDLGDTQRAYDLAQECLDADGDLAPAQVTIGRLHALRDEPFQAMAVARLAVTQHPGDAESWLLLADRQSESGDGGAAQASLDRALALRPTLASAWIARAECSLKTEDWAGAERAARAGLRLNPQSARALAALGRAQLKRAGNGEAEQSFRQAVALDPDNANAELGLAECFRSSRQYSAAISRLTELVGRRPLINEARAQLAECYAAEGQAEPERRFRSEFARWQRFLDERGRLRQAYAASSYDARVHLRIAALCARIGFWPEALRETQRGVGKVRQAQAVSFRDEIRRAYAQRGRPELQAALAAMEQALARMDGDRPRKAG
jgi:tetratricopeptide (TPR) repeat protein